LDLIHTWADAGDPQAPPNLGPSRAIPKSGVNRSTKNIVKITNTLLGNTNGKIKRLFFAREQNILLAAQMYHQWLSADKHTPYPYHITVSSAMPVHASRALQAATTKCSMLAYALQLQATYSSWPKYNSIFGY